MKHCVEVRISVPNVATDIWKLASDQSLWPEMPGAHLTLEVTQLESQRRLGYCIRAGLPVRDHRGELTFRPTPTGGTELMFTESFRPRIWGTGGYLRGRRERALIEAAQVWGSHPI